MAQAQFIHTPAGEEMVVLTRADYDALIAAAADAEEDAADAAMFDDRMAELANGLDAVLPPEVTAAMLKGASLLKAIRKWRSVTQVQLAEQTGLAQSYLSELEAEGGKKGARDAWIKIATALDVPADWLVRD